MLKLLVERSDIMDDFNSDENYEKANKNSNTIICILVILLLGTIGYIVYDKVYGEKVDNNETIEKKEEVVKNNTVEEVKNNTVEEVKDTSKNDYIVYYNKYGFCNSKSDNCIDYITIKTDTKDIKELQTYDVKYILYKDGEKTKVYDRDKDKSYVISLDDNYDGYEFVINKKDNKLLGIIYAKSNGNNYYKRTMGYYSINLNKKLYEGKYNELYATDGDYLSGSVYDCTNDCTFTKAELLSTDSEKVLLSELADEEELYFDFYEDNNNWYYVLLESIESAQHFKKIYTDDLKVLLSFSDKKVKFSDITFDKNGQIHVIRGNVVKIYDNKGNLVNTSDSFKSILKVIDEYIVAVKDNDIIITKLGGEETKICKYNSDYQIYSYKEDGIHVNVRDKSVKVDDVWNYYKDKNIYDSKKDIDEAVKVRGCYTGYNYYYDPSTKEVTKHHDLVCYN